MIFSTGGIAQGISFMFGKQFLVNVVMLSSLSGGLIFVPLLGRRGCLVFGCLLFTAGPLITYLVLDTNVTVLSFSYGVLGGCGANMIMVPTLVMPATWFPAHRGKVLGIVTSGYGFSSFVFTPLQTLWINPSNIAPVKDTNDNSSSSYFESEEVLDRIPTAMLYMGATLAAVFTVGVLLLVEKQDQELHNEGEGILQRLR